MHNTFVPPDISELKHYTLILISACQQYHLDFRIGNSSHLKNSHVIPVLQESTVNTCEHEQNF